MPHVGDEEEGRGRDNSVGEVVRKEIMESV